MKSCQGSVVMLGSTSPQGVEETLPCHEGLVWDTAGPWRPLLTQETRSKLNLGPGSQESLPLLNPNQTEVLRQCQLVFHTGAWRRWVVAQHGHLHFQGLQARVEAASSGASGSYFLALTTSDISAQLSIQHEYQASGFYLLMRHRLSWGDSESSHFSSTRSQPAALISGIVLAGILHEATLALITEVKH